MTKVLEQPQELSIDAMSEIAGGNSEDITTPRIPASPGTRNSVRTSYLRGLVLDALQGNGSIDTVLMLCKNERERSFVQELVATTPVGKA